MRRVVPLLLLAFTGACEAADTDGATPAEVVVESRTPQWGATDGWRLDTSPEVIIGDANGAPEYALANVVGAVRLSNGRIVIANRGTQDLRYYDAKGRYHRTVGREGNGPGEFRWIDAIGNAGDTVLVWDAFARRVSRFDGTAAFAGSTSVMEFDVPFPRLIGVLDDGTMLLRPRGDPEENANRVGRHVDSVTYQRYSARTGAHVKALGPFLDGEFYVAAANRQYMSARIIFGNQGLLAPAKAGFYTAETDRFAATFHRPDGAAVRTVRRPHTLTPATPADIAAWREKLEAGDEEVTRDFPQMKAAQRRLMAELPHRSTLPALTDIRVDRQDNLWLRAYVPPDAPAAGWSVFDPQGHWLGIVAVPADLQVLEIGDDWMLAKRVDPLDGVERVVLHRLRKPG